MLTKRFLSRERRLGGEAESQENTSRKETVGSGTSLILPAMEVISANRMRRVVADTRKVEMAFGERIGRRWPARVPRRCRRSLANFEKMLTHCCCDYGVEANPSMLKSGHIHKLASKLSLL